MATSDKNNFEKAYNKLSHIIVNLDNYTNKELLKDRLEQVQLLLENVKLD